MAHDYRRRPLDCGHRLVDFTLWISPITLLTHFSSVQEYFTGLNKQGFVGDVKKVECQYGPPPASVPKGVVQVTFIQSDAAYRALARLQGVEIDKRPLDVSRLLEKQFCGITLTPNPAQGSRYWRCRSRASFSEPAHHQRPKVCRCNQGQWQEREGCYCCEACRRHSWCRQQEGPGWQAQECSASQEDRGGARRRDGGLFRCCCSEHDRGHRCCRHERRCSDGR